jgi:hypothetical protein
MALKFKKISKLLLRNDAHFQFHTEFKDQLGKTAAATGHSDSSLVEQIPRTLQHRRRRA